MEVLFGIIILLVGILNIILFFKIWKMTNTVEKIYNLSLTKSGYKMVKVEKDEVVTSIFVKDE